MIWANVIDPSGGLAGLYEILAERLGSLSLCVETRRFKPHITLARVKHIREPGEFREAAAMYDRKDFGRQHASELVTYSSQLTPKGPIYTPIARTPLTA